MSIKSKDDLNKYYDLVNNLIDDYIIKWNIKPSNLKKYLKTSSKNFDRFLSRNKLSDIEGIEFVFNDVIDDRVSMEKDGVLTFESYNILESYSDDNYLINCLYDGISEINIKVEKILADYFDTNLSDINIEDSKKHLFNVESWSSSKKVIVYSFDDLKVIRKNIFEYVYNDLSKEDIVLIDNIKTDLKSLINQDILIQKLKSIFNKEYTIKTISKLTNFKFDKEISDHFIWIEKDATS